METQNNVEELLQQKVNFLESLINAAQVIILVLDLKGNIISVNPYMEKISGYLSSEIINENWFSIFLPKFNRLEIQKVFTETINMVHSRNINPILIKGGEEIMIEWHNESLKNNQDEIVGLLCIGNDVTERLKLETARLNLMNLLREAKKRLKKPIY